MCMTISIEKSMHQEKDTTDRTIDSSLQNKPTNSKQMVS
jgi:hypothetical protein